MIRFCWCSDGLLPFFRALLMSCSRSRACLFPGSFFRSVRMFFRAFSYSCGKKNRTANEIFKPVFKCNCCFWNLSYDFGWPSVCSRPLQGRTGSPWNHPWMFYEQVLHGKEKKKHLNSSKMICYNFNVLKWVKIFFNVNISSHCTIIWPYFEQLNRGYKSSLAVMFSVFVLILILFPILKIKSQQEHLNRGFNQGIYSFDIIFEQQNLYNNKLTKTVRNTQ